DILGKAGTDRFEKHEPAIEWIKMLTQSCFEIDEMQFKHVSLNETGLNIVMQPDGFIGFKYDTENILAIIKAI
ncbi:MAG TPA: hypothetical protein PLO59_00750, partial [Bacteroidia bacterium]|nr:hypothetical protein [Bacteroidia bacterium]